MQAITVPDVLGVSTLEYPFGQKITARDYSMRYGFSDKLQQAHLEMKCKAYLEGSRRAIRDDTCTEFRENVTSTNKCTD
jgi:hypothetical protein